MNKDVFFQFNIGDTNYTYTYNNDFEVLNKLKQSSKRLKELLNITEENINRAIKELRKEW